MRFQIRGAGLTGFLLLMSFLTGSMASTTSVPAVSAVSAGVPQTPLAWRISTGLAGLGPRPDGSATQEAAVRFLLDAMGSAGLQRIEAVPVKGHPEWVNLTAVVPGKSDREIVLSAHYDSIPEGPGAGDDASGCGVVIAAAADLVRTPLDHTVRVVLFDAEEKGLKGSQGWVEALTQPQRDRILADLNVEMVGWAGTAGPTIHSFPVQVDGRRTLAPGWLVHAVLRSGEAVGWPYRMSDAQVPFFTQLVLRAARVRLGADANAFVKAGIPALSISDSALLRMDPAYHKPADRPERLDATRMDGWTTAVTAAVRRMDKLAGRPSPDDEYLVLFDRVWIRRDLYWLGLGLWLLLAVRGRARGAGFASPEERSQAWRGHLPGVLFRALFLAAVLVAPVLSILLAPAALIAAFPPQKTWARAMAVIAGLLPVLAFLGTLFVAFALRMASWKSGFQILPVSLVLATALAFAVQMLKGREAKR